MNVMNVGIRDVANLQRKLAALSGEAERIAKKEVQVAAINRTDHGEAALPVDTGRLRNSITHEIRDAGLSAVVGTNVYYAPHVEFGTRNPNYPAQPFLFQAYQEVAYDNKG